MAYNLSTFIFKHEKKKSRTQSLTNYYHYRLALQTVAPRKHRDLFHNFNKVNGWPMDLRKSPLDPSGMIRPASSIIIILSFLILVINKDFRTTFTVCHKPPPKWLDQF